MRPILGFIDALAHLSPGWWGQAYNVARAHLYDVSIALEVRTVIGRMFRRLKDLRRIATRHDRLATNFLATVCLAAIFSYWL
jgi:transposase